MVQFDSQARSPWTPLAGVERLRLTPSQKRINATLEVPGSKSATNRALLLAAAASGTSTLRNALKSDDTYWCIEALKKMGVKIAVDGSNVTVYGRGGVFHTGSLYIGSAGTAGRFLPGMLAAATGNWHVEASHSMNKRPIAPLVETLQALGANIQYGSRRGHYPLSISGEGLNGGKVNMSGQLSSQFISGCLLAAPLAKNPVSITVKDGIVQQAYVRITIDLMAAFGVEVKAAPDWSLLEVNPSPYVANDIAIEADASTACYFLALAAITAGKIRIRHFSTKTSQPDILFVSILKRMGCNFEIGPSFVEGEGPTRLRGGFTVNMNELSDQALTLAAIAPFADGPIAIEGVGHIRHHECDRIRAICTELSRLGIRVEERHDGLMVYPGQPKPTVVNTYDDHRMAMALALIGAKVDGIELDDPGCVAKTCPSYFSMLAQTGIGVKAVSP
ncbi:3-phosphoshikimate 1-carboxyvinyltransferase [Shouchella clausii]|uniref:3-phosphoshikimate 1-carboxyvinyltransferase n=1 Tax=Shouchella clausii TaxID=79880 RepID=UPI002703DB3E|nr:3-phosphoshikimate 1-carboxyvinyltransferase [Shouchella clausii]MDO7270212.1 3-phosphoshikimate 1-carboxyvinyltransferase [Shouchella clausii]MDO7290023.1 3-phosphoshikimate 1-carboxyvinyltransferase [Shouchella clausii]